MTPTCADSPGTTTLAHTHAAANFSENRGAISRSRIDLQIADAPGDIEWVFGRDRALTARDAQERWLTGCSLPTRAAAEMMRTLEIAGPVACFLGPSHAAQLRVALDRLRPEQAIIAIVPDADQLPLLLSCDNFTADIDRGRLCFVSGECWAAALEKLFEDIPGLCTPTQFIRLPIADDGIVDGLIAPAQKVFADVNRARAAKIQSLRETYSRRSDRLCVVAPSNFRLWDDAGAALAELLAPCDPIRVDLDHPCEASTLALAQRAHDCGAIVTANIARCDLPGILSDTIPVITWASDARVPSPQGAAAHDRLITAYSTQAQSAGWGSAQIIAARWPGQTNQSQPSLPRLDALAMLVNTRPIDPPEYLSDFSSHRVLWELIAADLHDEPFALGEDVDSFLTRRMRKLDIAGETLPMSRIVSDLVLPAYQQSLARLLIRNKIPLRIFGSGWDRIPEFASHACGAIETREQLREIANAHAALVHVWPNAGAHAIDALARPVLRRRGSHGTSFLSDARQLVTGRAVAAPNSLPPLTREMIERR